MTMIGIRPEDRTNEAKEASNMVHQYSLKRSDSDSSQYTMRDSAESYFAKSKASMGTRINTLETTSSRSVSDKPNLWDEFFAAAPLPDDFMEE